MYKILEILVTNNQNTFSMSVTLDVSLPETKQNRKISSNINEFISSSFFLSSRFLNLFKFISDFFLVKICFEIQLRINTHKNFCTEISQIAPQNNLFHSLTILVYFQNFPFCTKKNTICKIQNIEMVARHPKISFGSWMHFSLSFATFIGRTLSSVNTSSSA